MKISMFKLYKLKLVDRSLGFDRLITEKSIHGASIKSTAKELAESYDDSELILQIFDLNTLPMKFLTEVNKNDFGKLEIEYSFQ